MSPPRYPPDDPREWLNRARSNLAMATSSVPGAYLEDLCFEAQQAAEKAIKAVLIGRNIRFPYIHDLGRLLEILEQSGEEIPAPVAKARELTEFAVSGRYPGLAEPMDTNEYRNVLETAESVVRWAEALLDHR